MTLCPRAGLHAYLHSRCGHVVLSNIHPNTSQYIVRIVPNTGHATKYCTLPSLPGPFSWLFLSFSWLSFFLSAAFFLQGYGHEDFSPQLSFARVTTEGCPSSSLSLSFFRQGCGQGKFPYPRALRRPRLLRRRRVKLALSLSLYRHWGSGRSGPIPPHASAQPRFVARNEFSWWGVTPPRLGLTLQKRESPDRWP